MNPMHRLLFMGVKEAGSFNGSNEMSLELVYETYANEELCAVLVEELVLSL